MAPTKRQEHWEGIYEKNQGTHPSWFQEVPQASLDFLNDLDLPLSAHFIDIGGGDSLLVDHWLAAGYTHISVLDISEKALARAKTRLGDLATNVQWIVSDIADFIPFEPIDLWHDRAAFHFMNTDQDVENYMACLRKGLRPGGVVIIGTFSVDGPTSCSGLPVRQYSEDALTALFQPDFDKIRCIRVDHQKPSGGDQQFVFCSFRKRLTESVE